MTISSSSGDVRWSLLEYDELADAYQEHVEPEFRADGHDPTAEKPTHAWLRENGFRTLLYTLREHHDTTFGTFWSEKLGYSENEAAEGYEWAVDDEATVEALDSFLESRRNRGDLSESSITVLRGRLNRYVRAYYAATGEDAVLRRVDPGGDVPAHRATDAAWEAIDRLDADADLADRTVARIHEAASQWYDYLLRRQRASVNPVTGVGEEYNWDRQTDGDPVALDVAHVRALNNATETVGERLLVIALCGWGLRSGEVAGLHASQFALTADPPFVAFDERKNGPGEVSLLYGVDVLEDRLTELSEREEWNGHLFPSSQSASGHIANQTVRNRFADLVTLAGLPPEIGGEPPVPQMGRRFWYSAYSEAVEDVAESIEEIAAEQGSSDSTVVLENYLSDERARQLRREHMRTELREAFD